MMCPSDRAQPPGGLNENLYRLSGTCAEGMRGERGRARTQAALDALTAQTVPRHPELHAM